MATYPSWDKHAHWVRVYRARIRLGLEKCRQCRCRNEWGTGRQLTLDHIHPRSRGGNSLMDNATILCADCNNRKSDGPARYRISLRAEELAAKRPQRWSERPVPEVPYGPWDEPGSRQPPRTARGVQRAVVKLLPPWARVIYVSFEPGGVPDWVEALVRSQYKNEELPSHVRRLIESG